MRLLPTIMIRLDLNQLKKAMFSNVSDKYLWRAGQKCIVCMHEKKNTNFSLRDVLLYSKCPIKIG